MTAKEFIEQEGLEYLYYYDDGGFVHADINLLANKLEEYHQVKLKELGLQGVLTDDVIPPVESK